MFSLGCVLTTYINFFFRLPLAGAKRVLRLKKGDNLMDLNTSSPNKLYVSIACDLSRNKDEFYDIGRIIGNLLKVLDKKHTVLITGDTFTGAAGYWVNQACSKGFKLQNVRGRFMKTTGRFANTKGLRSFEILPGQCAQEAIEGSDKALCIECGDGLKTKPFIQLANAAGLDYWVVNSECVRTNEQLHKEVHGLSCTGIQA